MELDYEDEMTPEEWQRLAEQSEKPIVFNFMILPKVPEHAGTFLDRDGEPVTTNYDKVDWKGLAQMLQARLTGHVPKAIKVYVANDGPDLFDINELNTARPSYPEPDNGFAYRTAETLEQVSMANYRGGLLKLPEDSNLHLNKVSAGQKRPPLSAVVVGVKFSKVLQAMDYLAGTMEQLVDIPFPVPMNATVQDFNEHGTLPPEVHGWFEEQFGAVYSKKCGLLLVSVTRTT